MRLSPRDDTDRFWDRLAHDLARAAHVDDQRDLRLVGRQLARADAAAQPLSPRRLYVLHRVSRAALATGAPRTRQARPADRDALERLCTALPDMMPARPACLTHGDFWKQNILATADGSPAVIDPRVSYMWADVDVAHLWSTPHPRKPRGSSRSTAS